MQAHSIQQQIRLELVCLHTHTIKLDGNCCRETIYKYHRDSVKNHLVECESNHKKHRISAPNMFDTRLFSFCACIYHNRLQFTRQALSIRTLSMPQRLNVLISPASLCTVLKQMDESNRRHKVCSLTPFFISRFFLCSNLEPEFYGVYVHHARQYYECEESIQF